MGNEGRGGQGFGLSNGPEILGGVLYHQMAPGSELTESKAPELLCE